MEWIDIDNEKPEEDQLCEVIGVFDKVEEMYYKSFPTVTLPSGNKHIVGRDYFYNSTSFLTDDIKYWRPKYV